MKVQVCICLESLLEYNQDQIKINHLGSYLRLALEVKTGREIPESSQLDFSENILANNFASLDNVDKNSGPLKVEKQQTHLCQETNSNSQKITRAKFLEIDRFICFIDTPHSSVKCLLCLLDFEASSAALFGGRCIFSFQIARTDGHYDIQSNRFWNCQLFFFALLLVFLLACIHTCLILLAYAF